MKLFIEDENGNYQEISFIRGENGANGLDGKSIEFSWDGTMLGVRLEGDSEYQYMNLKGDTGDAGSDGADGYTPQKGVDYWTEDDKQEMIDDVLLSLPEDTSLENRLEGTE